MDQLRAEVRLDQVIYDAGMSATAIVTLLDGAPIPKDPHVVFAGSAGGDTEVVALVPLEPDGRTLVTAAAVPIASSLDGPLEPTDGRLTLTPGEMFFALYSVRQPDRASQPGDLAAGFALMRDPSVGPASEVVPELAMSEDETKVPAGGKRIATLGQKDALPVQVAVGELVFYPRDERQLKAFLDDTGGELLAGGQPFGGDDAPAPALVGVSTASIDVDLLPQLRALYGEEEPLLASSSEGLAIYALTLLQRARGYLVGVNPRLHFMGAPTTTDGLGPAGTIDVMSTNRAVSSPCFADDLFGVRRAWAYLALWDRDSRRIPVAFLDMGFAPNWDFRGFPGSIPQRNLANGSNGPGSALGPPTVGASFFGSPVWHGNGLVTTAAGVPNNGYGSAGTGGQVVTPLLYKMDLASYAFEMGTGIRLAVADGATIVNISAAYPCAILTNVGLEFDVCSPGGRLAFCGVATAALRLAVVHALAVPVVGPFLAIAAEAAFTTALGACLAILLVGDPRGPLGDAVAFARSRGVTVVSVAGNVPGVPPPLNALIPTTTQDVSRWQVVPGVLPDVICVGAANPTPPYANNQNFGSRVDVWAPIGDTYFAPPTISSDDGPNTHVAMLNLGGTSASAPYVAGVIAMMQAINPSLDPRTPGLSDAARRAIPGFIRGALVSTATPASALPVDPTNPEVSRRRNMVNAFAAVRAAGVGVLPDVIALGYGTGLGFDEVGPAARHDTLASAKVVPPTGGTEVGTILSLPRGEGPGGTVFTDQDWYVWRTPPENGIYGRAEHSPCRRCFQLVVTSAMQSPARRMGRSGQRGRLCSGSDAQLRVDPAQVMFNGLG